MQYFIPVKQQQASETREMFSYSYNNPDSCPQTSIKTDVQVLIENEETNGRSNNECMQACYSVKIFQHEVQELNTTLLKRCPEIYN
jgi:hypothetical protein